MVCCHALALSMYKQGASCQSASCQPSAPFVPIHLHHTTTPLSLPLRHHGSRPGISASPLQGLLFSELLHIFNFFFFPSPPIVRVCKVNLFLSFANIFASFLCFCSSLLTSCWALPLLSTLHTTQTASPVCHFLFCVTITRKSCGYLSSISIFFPSSAAAVLWYHRLAREQTTYGHPVSIIFERYIFQAPKFHA